MNYTVRRRDTLTAIAERHGTTVDALAELNHIRDPNRIRVGQRLRIPGQGDDFTVTVTSPSVTSPTLSYPTLSNLDDEVTTPQARPPSAPLWRRFWDNPRATVRSAWEVVNGRPADGSAVTDNTQPVHVDVPFYLQTESGHGFRAGRRACFRAARQMALDAGGSVSDVTNRIQVAAGESGTGRVRIDSTGATRGRAHIDAELSAGRPVVVGVSHKDADYNADGVTDHFVTITGRGVDDRGRVFYTFHDPGTRSGRDSDPRNRFYVDPQSGLMYRPEDYTSVGLASRRYEVAMVR